MDILAEARRRAFSVWLRTGRLPRWAQPANREVKYNPWHDPEDGRFTFRGTGRYVGRGGGGEADVRMDDRPKVRGRRREPYGGFGGGGQGFNGGGAGGSWDAPDRGPWWDPNGKTPAGRAASRTARPNTQASPRQGDNEGRPSNRRTARTTQPLTDRNAETNRPANRVAGRSARNDSQEASDPNGLSPTSKRDWKPIERNGYKFHIDDRGRTRRVEGKLTLNDTQPRSRSAQARAGGSDRRTSDEGGHYIARRFNGPTEAFNHFAQDANFNRGLYRSVENQWAKALRAGRSVKVEIEPVYQGTSRRPKTINVSFWIDGLKRRVKFPNERREGSSAKR